MRNLRVGVDDVQAMASRWRGHAADLGGSAPSGSGLSCQSSAEAVLAGHANVEAVKAVLSGRVLTTAAKVVEAHSRYVANEANSAAQLAAVDGR